MMRTVPVRLAGRAYDVVIGDVLGLAGERLRPLLKQPRLAVVADAAVAALHGERLRAALAGAGVEAPFVEVPPGEASKSFAGLERLLGALLDLELGRGDVIVAFGGGVVGDLAGFAAAVYKRGVRYVQIPTTLLAQVDSSVGGKTAIDTPQGKNLLGAFHQPSLVLADFGVLATLPARELAAGYAEIVKYGLIGDEPFFAWLEQNGARVLALEPEALAHAVATSVEHKAAVVAEDEREEGRRALLNLGHTFAHAFEAETGFGGALLHGEAVALGCTLAFRFSARRGLCPPADARRVEAVLEAARLPVRIGDLDRPFSAERLVQRMRQDKKAEGGRLTLILARGIGRAFTAPDADLGAVRDFLIAEGAQP
jgi:3-dehydroquinate synthase